MREKIGHNETQSIWMFGGIRMKRILFIAALLMMAAFVCNGASAGSLTPAMQNQFIEVQDFLQAHRAPNTLVSVTGYLVLATEEKDGAIRLSLVDSADHVLGPRDALTYAKGGATVIIPKAFLLHHKNWQLNPKGLMKYVMYFRTAKGIRKLHDSPAQVRVTGDTIKIRGLIKPLKKLEYSDENGNWRNL